MRRCPVCFCCVHRHFVAAIRRLYRPLLLTGLVMIPCLIRMLRIVRNPGGFLSSIAVIARPGPVCCIRIAGALCSAFASGSICLRFLRVRPAALCVCAPAASSGFGITLAAYSFLLCSSRIPGLPSIRALAISGRTIGSHAAVLQGACRRSSIASRALARSGRSLSGWRQQQRGPSRKHCRICNYDEQFLPHSALPAPVAVA